MIRVIVLQHRLVHYRIRLFELLREQLAKRDVDLALVHGQASEEEKRRKDEGHLDWAFSVSNRFFRIAEKDLIWQPLPQRARDADLYVLIQENRILSNYWLQLTRPFNRRLICFWGHGRNYQSKRPSGLRERWKTWWLCRVDWWFAYTGSTCRYVAGHGFAADRITNLENAIDGTGFASDLASFNDSELAQARAALCMSADAQVAIYCGSLYEDKRIGVLLRSADLLRQRLPDFHLLVVGDGPEAQAVRNAVVSRPWMHVMGVCIGREKALYFRLAQLMLNPGLVGLHVVDAFVARTPIVTQASAPHSPEYDYLVDGENGRVVSDDSPASYADAVERLFMAPGALDAMHTRCGIDAGRYTLENMVGNFADGIVACLIRHGRLPSCSAQS